MNWEERIQKTRINGKFSEEDQLFASHYQACVVGEKHFNLYGNFNIMVLKMRDELFDLGLLFDKAVRENNFTLAENLRIKILEYKGFYNNDN